MSHMHAFIYTYIYVYAYVHVYTCYVCMCISRMHLTYFLTFHLGVNIHPMIHEDTHSTSKIECPSMSVCV